MDRLIDWREHNFRIPFYLSGARGVGKTYLAMEFAKDYFSVILYQNFETDPFMNEHLSKLRGDSLIEELFHYNQENEKASFLSLPFREKSTLVEQLQSSPESIVKEQSTILILDEISYSTCLDEILFSVLQSNYNIPIIMINSREYEPEVIRQQFVQVMRVKCFPMDFEEFLQATGNEWYISVINEHFDSNGSIPEIVHKELLELYDIYLLVGGLPDAINEYLNFGSLSNVAECHRLKYGDFLQDINQWENPSNALKMKQVVETIPYQLQKKNKKFQYTYIRKGTTRTMYGEAIEALKATNQVLLGEKMTDSTQFKLYWFDTGFLASLYRSQKFCVQSSTEVKLALLENSVAQAFFSKEYELHFWESPSLAKIEFVLGKKNLLPIELFPDENTRSKNVSVFKETHQFDYAVKISSRNFQYKKGIKYVPYYAIGCL